MPSFSSNYSDAQVMMTLAATTYCTKSRIDAVLADAAYATEGKWQRLWGPGTDAANLLFVAGMTGVNVFAVAIRGTDINLATSLIGVIETLK